MSTYCVHCTVPSDIGEEKEQTTKAEGFAWGIWIPDSEVGKSRGCKCDQVHHR